MSTTATDVKAIGERLVELCKQGKNIDAINELFADDAVSVEAMACESGNEQAMPRVTEGKAGIAGKNQWWFENMQVHSGETIGPFPHQPDRFAAIFKADVTCKQTGNRMQMEEIGLYTVSDGKIVKEEFFYDMPGA